MKKEQIASEFEEAYPELMALSPIIRIDEIIEYFDSSYLKTIKYDPPLIQITIQHPFIFDNRLVPSEFNGIKVKNEIIGNFPAEFPEPTENTLLKDYYALDRYIKFVNRKIDIIRKKLKDPALSIEEAVKALTFGFVN